MTKYIYSDCISYEEYINQEKKTKKKLSPNIRIICNCGGNFWETNLLCHLKTKKHRHYIISKLS